MKKTMLPPALMLQGTCSNAGKSILATAVCRILARAGYNVAPFKAQNMSLNSFVTSDGKEMGRAQALQAEACYLLPDSRMNPVLLKPVRNHGSEIICNGLPAGYRSSKDFAVFRRDLWEAITESYSQLASEHDVMILEGAGSPAEINLRDSDLANMRMARYADARVLLVADIDRGGAFAALAGTMLLLTPDERELVSGFLVNKFRGEKSLLTGALEAITARTGRRFFGVIPWIDRIDLPDEDSVCLQGRTGLFAPVSRTGGAVLDVAVVALPHMSNASDFDAFRVEKDVSLRLIRDEGDFGLPDILLLPGTRNTFEDLSFLRTTGLSDRILHFSDVCERSRAHMLIGICGGFQILGAGLFDPCGIELSHNTSAEEADHELADWPRTTPQVASNAPNKEFSNKQSPNKEFPNEESLNEESLQEKTVPCARRSMPPVRGLGLLDFDTLFQKRKILKQVSALALPPLTDSPTDLVGYEIHQGATTRVSSQLVPIVISRQGEALGYGRISADGGVRIFGTYVHGLFDANAFRHAILTRLRREKGLPEQEETAYSRESALDRLADRVERELPLSVLQELLHI